MPLSRACRYCRSPARGNPCWYFLDHPEYATSGGDPPCTDDDYRDEYVQRMDRRRKNRWRNAIILLVGAFAIAGMVLLFR